jgi:hypothetical protein
VAASGCDFEGALGAFLSAHVFQIGELGVAAFEVGFRAGERLQAFEVVDE